MLAVPDTNFRKGLGFMLTGLWVTFFALLWGAFGGLGVVVGLFIALLGGMVLAYGYDVMNRMPPTGAISSPQG